MSNRRAFLKFLAGSPLLAAVPAIAQAVTQAAGARGQAVAPNPANDILSVMDFEALAEKAIPLSHWGYLASGVDDDLTVKANRAGFTRFQLRERRLVDVSRIDMAVTLFGTTYPTPIGFSPIGSTKAFSAEGEVGTAKAAKARNALQILSTQASNSIEEVTAARGAPIWHQLYTTNRWEVTQQFLKRAQAAGCPAVAITLDSSAGRNTETQARFRQRDTRDCTSCHGPNGPGQADKPMFTGLTGVGLVDASLTWDFVKKVKDATTMKVVLKGLETREDAQLAVENGADGIIVSNHGGRASESGRGTIEALPEVVLGAAGRIPVLIDGGFRRGTDVYKALALGATAVFVGRPHIWGLAAFGQAGVERVHAILQQELRLVMGQCGTPTIKSIGPASIIDTGRRA